MLWQKIDAESFAMDEEEDDLEECDAEEVLEKLDDELKSTIAYHENNDVREYAQQLMVYVERLQDLIVK